jgi:hypothetical protein
MSRVLVLPVCKSNLDKDAKSLGKAEYLWSVQWFHWFPLRRQEYSDEQVDRPAFGRYVA